MIANLITGFQPPAGAWSPLDLPDLKAWYDASDATTITGAVSVSQWNDKSGNSYNLTQATGVKQPTTNSVTQNGKNVISFDGGDTLVASTASNWTFLNDGTNNLVGIVAKVGLVNNPNTWQVILGTSDDSSVNRGWNFGLDDRSAAKSIFDYATKASAGNLVLLNSGNNTMTPNAFHYVTMIHDLDNATAATRSKVYVDTGSVVQNNTQTNAPSASAPTSPLNIGSANSVLYMTGYVAEVVIAAAGAADETNRALLADYLKTKWGL
jgi:hypothetical protein